MDISDLWGLDGWKKKKDRSQYNFIDLFSGAGGLTCGLVMAGLNPIASVEIMPQAVATYTRNFVKHKGFKEKTETNDIRKKEVKDKLYKSVEGKHIDVIVGGFPCQGFSLSGYRVVDDPRNSLYKEMKEIVDHLKPDFVVMENVEGLRSMLNGKVEEKIISDYKKIGYNINITVLNSADYYTPQIRHRVIFIGNRVGVKNYHPKPLIDEEHYVTVGHALKKYLDMSENKEINHIFTKTSPSMQKRLEELPVGKSLYSNYSDAWKKVDWNKPSCTVKENHGGVNIHPLKNRPMTPRELAALQSFPDDFILEGNKTLSLKTNIGKMVCPPEVGQPGSQTAYKFFKAFVTQGYIDKDNFKSMVFEHINELIPIYISHLFDSDYLLRIYSKTNNHKLAYEVLEKGFGTSLKWDLSNFSFSKDSIEKWNESNTVYYNRISLGEFQIHKNRNCFKFRFNFENLLKTIEKYGDDYPKQVIDVGVDKSN